MEIDQTYLLFISDGQFHINMPQFVIIICIQIKISMHQAKYTDKVTRGRLKNNTKTLNEFIKCGPTLGEGPYSKIKRWQSQIDSKYYAMKKYNLSILKKKTQMRKLEDGTTKYYSVAEDVRAEIEVWRNLDHKHIAKLLQIIEDKEEQKIYLIMQYCSEGDIAKWNAKEGKYILKEQFTAISFLKAKFRQMCEVLSYLHKLNIVHRDIKPQNMLIDQSKTLKLIDFGRSVQLASQQQKLKGSVGTYHFMAPQMLSEMFPNGYEGKRCDIWALGVSWYCILFNELPFDDELLIKLFQKIQKANYSFPENPPKDYGSFIPIIAKMLSLSPFERPSADELLPMLTQ